MRQDTKSKLIEAGIEAMLEKSYHAVGIKEILDRVGVPKGSFYHYFKSKEDFGIEIIDTFARMHAEELQSFAEDRSISPIERLKNSFLSSLKTYTNKNYGNNCLIAKLSHEVIIDSPNMHAAIKNAFDSWQGIYARMIREAQNDGELGQEFDPDTLASFIQNSWEGAIMMMQVQKSYEPVRNCIRFIFKELLKVQIDLSI